MNQSAYFDVNGSTPLDPAVRETWLRFAADLWGNPSATHAEGLRAREVVERARHAVARGLGAGVGEIWFTSGGTESNNWALAGAARAAPAGRRHLVVSSIEHKSVLRTAEALERDGCQVTVLAVDSGGRVQLADVERSLRPETFLVALMLANNETGVLQPVREVARLCRERGVLLHCDAVAALGKVDVDVRDLGVDLLSLSGHKLYAPKGTGVLFVRRGSAGVPDGRRTWWDTDGACFPPLIHGCGQQQGMRSGTENTAGAAALGTAFERLAEGAFHREDLGTLRERLWEGIQQIEPHCQLNGSGPCLPNTLSVAFPGRAGAALQAALGERGFSVSAGAATTNGAPSHVLLAMGLGVERARSTLRFSLGAFHDAAAIDGLLAALRGILNSRPQVEDLP